MKAPKNEVEQIGDVMVIGVGGIGLRDLARALRPVIRQEVRRATADTMLSGAEAAELLGVSRVTIYNWIQAGKLTDHGNGNGTAAKISRRQVLKIKERQQLAATRKSKVESKN